MKPFSLALLALAGCATVPPPSVSPTAGIGESASVNGLRVRPLRVVEDSRCPVKAVCVWQGRLRLEAEIEAAGGSETHRTILTLREPVALGGGTLTLVDAQPAKLDVPVQPKAYRFTFSFGRRP